MPSLVLLSIAILTFFWEGQSLASQTKLNSSARILLLGDVQLKSTLGRKVTSLPEKNRFQISLSDWGRTKVDYSDFDRLDIRSLVEKHSPVVIFQAGDMVESDNAYALHLTLPDGKLSKFEMKPWSFKENQTLYV